MGQTRVDLLHLLEDLRDAYPGEIEETILTEIVANCLDSGATRISVLTDPAERTVVVIDDGSGMARRELARYHDIAASNKTRGEGIGFAGVGIKLGLLVAEDVLTETRRGGVHVATRWHLASKHRAPWRWVDPPGWVAERGTAVGLKVKNALSSLLNGGYVEEAVRRHFEPLFDSSFDEILRERYPQGVAFLVNGRLIPKRGPLADGRATVTVRLPRKRKPSAFGWLEHSPIPLREERQGIAVSTLGKVIRRGWDWLGLAPAAPLQAGGLVEAPDLAATLTLNKGDFVRQGRRGMTYVAYRKALQEAVSRQLDAWGERREQEEDTARRRAARPVERDLESVLVDLAEEFPVLSALVERRPGGQKRLPTGNLGDGRGRAVAIADVPAESGGGEPVGAEPSAEPPPEDAAAAQLGGEEAASSATESSPAGEPEEAPVSPPVEEPPGPGSSVLEGAPASRTGPRRPTKYGLAIDFEERPGVGELGRLVETTVLVNTAHPAYTRAVASKSEAYHVALTVGMALAPLAAEPAKAQEFLTAFLARWGKALGRDRRRRQARPRH